MPDSGPLRASPPTGEEDRAVQALKIPPHSIEAEQSVLGALLLDNHSLDIIAPLLREIDFYRSEHSVIFQSIAKLINENKPADVLTVHEELKSFGLSENFGITYLNELASNTPSSANIRGYAQIINDRSILRRLIQTADSIANSAFSPEKGVRTLLDEAEARILAIGQEGGRQNDFHEIESLMTQTVERIQELYARGGSNDITGVATGFIDLDAMTSGLQKGDLVIVAGRPSMGKTSFAMNIAEHVAIKEDLPVLIFSMEMSATQLASRMLGSVGRVNQGRLRTGRLTDEEWPRVTQSIGLLTKAPMLIDETGSLNSLELRARARRMARKYGNVGLIVIDYLQLMSGKSSGATENRATEISEISRSLKSLAKEMQCPVVALSQLNRSLENRENKRPMMSDLRESGAIEQDADLILFIYRDEVYHPESEAVGIAEIIIAKQRNGPIGPVKLSWQGEFTKFDNLARGYTPAFQKASSAHNDKVPF